MRIVLLVLLLVASAARADNTPTPGPNDCCQCPAPACAAPLTGLTCEGSYGATCFAVYDAACVGTDCATVTPTSPPTDTPTITPTPPPTDTPTISPTETDTPTCIPQAGVPLAMVVTTTDDHNDWGSCCSATDCTLREAIGKADPEFVIRFCTGVDTPIVGCPGAVTGTITLDCGAFGDGGINIGEAGTITGPGSSLLTISGNDCTRIFQWHSTGGDSAIGTLTGLTLAHAAASSIGGAIAADTTPITIIADHVVFDTNQAAAATGGAIYSNYAVQMSNTTFSNNTATRGGALHLQGPSGQTSTFTNVTFTNNTATNDEGGAVEDCNASNTVYANCTFTGNTAPTRGGGVNFCAGAMTLDNVTFGTNTPNDVYDWDGSPVTATNTIFGSSCGQQTPGDIVSGGHNIDSGTGCGLSGTGDQSSSDPLLNALANNGGATQTMSLQGGSPAIDSGDDAVCAAAPVSGVDQRGATRPGVGQTHCSIGAYEEQVATPTPAPTLTPGPCTVISTDASDCGGSIACDGSGTCTVVCSSNSYCCTTINFALPTGTPTPIELVAPLVDAVGVTIDCTTQTGFSWNADYTLGFWPVIFDAGGRFDAVTGVVSLHGTMIGCQITGGTNDTSNPGHAYGVIMNDAGARARANYVHGNIQGISCSEHDGTVIGGPTPSDGNVVVNNSDYGIGFPATNTTPLPTPQVAQNNVSSSNKSGILVLKSGTQVLDNSAQGNVTNGIEIQSGVVAADIERNHAGDVVCNGVAQINDAGTGTILVDNVVGTCTPSTPTPTATPVMGCYVLAGAGCNVPPISAPVTCLDSTVAAGFGQPTIADGCTFINGLVPGCCLTLVADAPGCDPLGNALGACTAPTPTPTDTPAVTPTATPTPTPTSVGCCQSVGKGCWCAKSATPPPTSGLVCQDIAAPLCSIGVKSSRCCGGTNRGAICVSDNDCPGGTCEPCAVTSWAAAQTCSGLPNEQCVGAATFTPTRTRTPTKTPTPTRTFTPTQTFTPHAGHPSYVNLACPTPPCVGTPVPAGPGWKTAFFAQESGTCTQDVYCQSPSKNATPVPVQCIGGYTDVTGDGYCTFRTNCYQAMCAVTGSTSCVASCWIEDWQEWTQRYPQ